MRITTLPKEAVCCLCALMLRSVSRLLPLVLCLLPLMALGAEDRVHLRDGRSFAGSVIRQNRTTIWLRLETGAVREFSKRDVFRVVYDTKDTEARRKAEARKRQEAEERKRDEIRRGEEARKAEEARKRNEAQRKAADPRPTLLGSLWRSAVLPGWGQFHQGRTLVAGGFGVTFLGLAYNAKGAADEFRRSSASYRASASILTLAVLSNHRLTPVSDQEVLGFSLRHKAASNQGQARVSAAGASRLLGYVYALNLLDVVFLGGGSSVVRAGFDGASFRIAFVTNFGSVHARGAPTFDARIPQ